MQDYFTKTERIQNYIRNILDDEQKHSTKEIVEYVDGKLKENGEFVFQINSYVNAALRLIMKNEDYAKVAHGMYQKAVFRTLLYQEEQSRIVTWRNSTLEV